MSTEQAALVERRTESHKKIQSLVIARTQTLTLYSELAALQPFDNKPQVPILLQTFCQALIDYTASAHFTLYKYIDESTERRRSVLDIAAEVYPKIVSVTQSILKFNDKYDCAPADMKMTHLAADLSRLGEALADRIEWEDRLIAQLTQRRNRF